MAKQPGDIHMHFKLEDAPKWLNRLEFSRDGDHVMIDVIKESEFSYGHVRIPIDRFIHLMDMLLEEGA